MFFVKYGWAVSLFSKIVFSEGFSKKMQRRCVKSLQAMCKKFTGNV